MTFAYFSSEKSRAPAASRTGYTFGKRPRDAEGEKKLLSFLINPSVTATPCHLPLHRGGFWLAVLLKYHIAVITLSKNNISKKGFFCVTHN